MPRWTGEFIASPLHIPPLLLLLSQQLAPQTQAFVISPPRAPHDVAVRRWPTSGGKQRAAVEGHEDAVSLTAEEWHGFGEEDHDRFLAEFWQKKPLLIRQAVKGCVVVTVVHVCTPLLLLSVVTNVSYGEFMCRMFGRNVCACSLGRGMCAAGLYIDPM